MVEMVGYISSPDTYAALLSKAVCFVCTDEHRLAGMAFLVPSGNPTDVFDASWAYIRMVGVHPAFQGQGIARPLTQLCIDHARAGGEQLIALHTSELMDAARHIYSGLGFRQIREIAPIYYKRYWLYLQEL